MKKTHLKASVFGLLAMLVGASSSAQAGGLSPYAGIVLGKNSLTGRWTSGEQLDERKLGFAKKTSYAVGALFGCLAHKGNFVYGGELDLGTGAADALTEVQDEGDDRQVIKTRMSFLSHARLILGYKMNDFTAYLGLGVAATRFNFTLDEPDDEEPTSQELTSKSSVSFGTSLSGGIAYDVNDKLSVRLEGGQDLFSGITVPGFGESYEMAPKVNFVRIGVTYKI